MLVDLGNFHRAGVIRTLTQATRLLLLFKFEEVGNRITRGEGTILLNGIGIRVGQLAHADTNAAS